MMTCYNASGEIDDEEDPRAVDIPELEGTHDIVAPEVPGDKFKQLLKLKKVNIRTIEDPKFASIGDYWDDSTMGKVIDLLHDFRTYFQLISLR